MARIVPIPCLEDNYAYLVICEATKDAAVVDPSEAPPVLEAVRREGVNVRAIWCTHHHPDHVGGNEDVLAALGELEVAGHASDRGRIPGQNRFLETGDAVEIGRVKARAVHVPGHTSGAVAYVVEGDAPAVFTGDTLFLAGCGRLFEGTAAQMHASLTSLASLAPETRVYVGHEYTASNLKFAAHVEPSNAEVTRAADDARTKRAAKTPTVPGTVAQERATNPFMRVNSAEIRRTLGIPAEADDAAALAAVRKAKDTFR